MCNVSGKWLTLSTALVIFCCDRTVERPSVEAVIAEDQEEMWACSSASRHVTSHLTPQSDQSQKYAVFFMRLTGSSKRKVIRQRYE